MGVRYATREAVKAALDAKETARTDAQVDDAIEASTDLVNGLLRRSFRPIKATKSYDWPDSTSYANSWTLWLDNQPDQLISLDSITTGGVALSVSDVILYPTTLGPPYNRLDINFGSGSSWRSGSSTWQQSIALVGTWGYRLDYTAAGATAEALDDTETGIDVTNSAAIGVGDMILIESEWINVTGKQSLTSAQTTTSSLAASLAIDSVPTSGGTFFVGETITVDTERMLIVDILGANLVVKRGYDGSTLAAHNTAATVYVQRTLVGERGARGSTAASHGSGIAIYRHDIPAGVRNLAIAESVNTILQRRAGYARTVGVGDSEQESAGRQLGVLRKDTVAAFGRTLRKAAI